MNRTELCACIAARSSMSRADAATALDALVSAIADALESGEAVNIANDDGRGEGDMLRRCESAAMRWARAAVALACVIVAQASAGEGGEHRVYQARDTIRFERHCANAEAYRVQAYAELASDQGRAGALVLAYARHDAVRRDDIFIGLRLVALRIEAEEDGADSYWSMRLEARGAAGGFAGTEHAHYDSNPARGQGERRAFRADAAGTLDWLDFTEPEEEGDRGLYPHHWSPEMETTAAQLALTDSAREVVLDLVLTQVDSGESLRLPGPTLRVPDRIWHGCPPKPKTLGLLAALNPFEEGGVWQWAARGVKYGKCIEERRAAKRRFAAQP